MTTPAQGNASGRTVSEGTWTPLLRDGLQARALEVCDAIATHLQSTVAQVEPIPAAVNLCSGAAGITLFITEYAQLRAADAEAAADAAWEFADQLLGQLMEAAPATTLGGSLYEGYAGVAWVIERMASTFEPWDEPEGAEEEEEEDGDDDPTGAIEALLLSQLRGAGSWAGAYDLTGGLTGLAVYLLERLPRPAAAGALDLIARHLIHLAQHQKAGVAWHTPTESLPPLQRRGAPNGYYNMGMAHGLPAVVAICAELATLDLQGDRLIELVRGATRWLEAHKTLKGGSLPPWVTEAGRPGPGSDPTRLAWCYGDLGASLGLLRAGRLLHDSHAEQLGLELGARVAQRGHDEHSGVQDAGLCHGSAGVGHCFNRLFQATRDERHAEAARHWIGNAIQRFEDAGLAGLHPLVPVEAVEAWGSQGGQLRLNLQRGFLEGLSGVGLALLAAASTTAPGWDRLMLIDVPSAPPG